MNAFFRLSTILCHMCLHSPVGGRLGCFHILAIANNCAMNMRMQITLRYAVFISFEICPKWNRWIIWSPIFVFLRSLHIVCHRGCTVSIPTNSAQRFLFFHTSLPTLVVSYLLNNNHPNRWERRRQWHPTPVLLPGKSHGQRSLVGCSPWGR